MKEIDIQRSICDYLAVKQYFFWRQNNTPIYDRGQGRFRSMPKYSLHGIPDIIVLLPEGKTCFLEVKTKKGVLSDHQKTFRDNCERLGHDYFVVTSIEEVQELAGL